MSRERPSGIDRALGHLILAACMTLVSNEAPSSARPWTSQDSASVRYVSLRSAYPEEWWLDEQDEPQVVSFSPDGRYFFFLTHRGDVESDARFGELHVYEVEAVTRHLSRSNPQDLIPPPYRKLNFRSFSSDPVRSPIKEARWEDGRSNILFRAMTSQGTIQAHRLDISSGIVTQLTRHPESVSRFYARGAGLLFEVQSDVPLVPSYPETRFQRRESSLDFDQATTKRTVSTFVTYSGREGVPLQSPVLARYATNWLSPDGRFAISLVDPVLPLGRLPSRAVGSSLNQWFALLNLQTGQAISLFSVEQNYRWRSHPIAFENADVFWASDSSRVIFTRAIPTSSKGERSSLVEYEIASAKWRVLEPMKAALGKGQRAIAGIGWLKDGAELLVTHTIDGKPTSGTVYSFGPAGAVGRSVDSSVTVPQARATRAFVVELRQGPNEPPQVVASNGERRLGLPSSDPALANVWMARSEPFQWQEDGQTETGGLMLPRNFTPGSPVPLVIHAYHYLPKWFLPDGQTKTPSEAKQALVARGFAVLEIEITDNSLNPEKTVARVDAAVEGLVRAGIVDSNRVGMTGFSRGGYHTYFTITHPGRTRIAAAICADSFKGDYSAYLLNAAFGGRVATEYAVMGPETSEAVDKSFWNNRAKWLERETSFNVDRVRGATLITFHSYPATSHMTEMPTVGALLLNKKPVDYLYFPTGNHELQRPRERIAMMEATVDWMAFWLQGYEDPSPHKAEQNATWRAIRDHQVGH